jgi:hypothetical protein
VADVLLQKIAVLDRNLLYAKSVTVVVNSVPSPAITYSPFPVGIRMVPVAGSPSILWDLAMPGFDSTDHVPKRFQ